MRSFDVYLPSDSESIPIWTDHPAPYTVEGEVEQVPIDTVFFLDSDTIDIREVRESLIDHDGYPFDINVEESTNDR